MPKRANVRPVQPASISWDFDPGVPTDDVFEGFSLTDMWRFGEVVENFIYGLEEDYYLTWEAVMCEEQGIRLSARQKAILAGLLDFNDDPSDEILYINEIARPSQPWYAILRRIAPRLIVEPYRTFDCHDEIHCDGWGRIAAALRERGEGLSLPAGAQSWEDVLPADLRHKLWLQFCFRNLYGLGQSEDFTLADPSNSYVVDRFIEDLRECEPSVAHFKLTLKSLLGMIVLPERDQPIFSRLMRERLGGISDDDPIAGRLR